MNNMNINNDVDGSGRGIGRRSVVVGAGARPSAAANSGHHHHHQQQVMEIELEEDSNMSMRAMMPPETTSSCSTTVTSNRSTNGDVAQMQQKQQYAIDSSSSAAGSTMAVPAVNGYRKRRKGGQEQQQYNFMSSSTTTYPAAAAYGGRSSSSAVNKSNNKNKTMTRRGRKFLRRSDVVMIVLATVGTLVLIGIVIYLLLKLAIMNGILDADNVHPDITGRVHERIMKMKGYGPHGGGGGYGGHGDQHGKNKHGRQLGRGGRRRPPGNPWSLHSHTAMDNYESLAWNPIYKVPDAMDIVGDRSDEYAIIRQTIDELLPPNPQRSLSVMKQLKSDLNLNFDIADMLMDNDPITAAASRALGANAASGGASGGQHVDHNSDQIEAVEDDAVAPYDVYDCPDEPPQGYPFQWSTLSILRNWPVNNITIPNKVHQGICIFDYTNKQHYDAAMTYRKAEVPFIVMNDPEVARTVERWNYPGYMNEMMGNVRHRCEYSENNHFMYYIPVSSKRKKPPPPSPAGAGAGRRGGAGRHGAPRIQPPEGWKEPTKMLRMTFDEWLSHANVSSDGTGDEQDVLGPSKPHWYFRLIGCGLMGSDGSCDKGSSEYLYDELPFFQPKSNLYMVEPDEQKGIHCRFGMNGVIAENHFDGSRNTIVLLGGKRRYILSHPNQCKSLALYPKGHPSARHSAIDWSHPNIDEYPEFVHAKSNEIILQPGYVLYLPTNWFHFIVSLGLNFQCNARSGISNEYMNPMKECGF